jgi:hypothetical protein
MTDGRSADCMRHLAQMRLELAPISPACSDQVDASR